MCTIVALITARLPSKTRRNLSWVCGVILNCMTNKPYLNAALAFAYIIAIGCFIFYGQPFLAPLLPDIAGVILILSLLVLSVAFMATTFFLTPFRLAFEGNIPAGVSVLVRTLLYFGGIIALFLLGALLIYG